MAPTCSSNKRKPQSLSSLLLIMWERWALSLRPRNEKGNQYCNELHTYIMKATKITKYKKEQKPKDRNRSFLFN